MCIWNELKACNIISGRSSGWKVYAYHMGATCSGYSAHVMYVTSHVISVCLSTCHVMCVTSHVITVGRFVMWCMRYRCHNSHSHGPCAYTVMWCMWYHMGYLCMYHMGYLCMWHPTWYLYAYRLGAPQHYAQTNLQDHRHTDIYLNVET